LFDSESEKQNLTSIARAMDWVKHFLRSVSPEYCLKEGFSGLAGVTDSHSHQDSTF